MIPATSIGERLLRAIRAFRTELTALPNGVDVLDPLGGPAAAEVDRIVTAFHQRYYPDDRPRLLLLGINPGRLGAGSTGLCFTDTIRCTEDLGIPVNGFRTYEPSSDFFYRMVRAAGGATTFYAHCAVQSICPLGFTRPGPSGAPINLNYYDLPALQQAVTPFIVDWLRALLATGMRSDRVLCIGTGKNHAFLRKLNAEHRFFRTIVPLEHPRYILQYKAREVERYIDKYLQALVD